LELNLPKREKKTCKSKITPESKGNEKLTTLGTGASCPYELGWLLYEINSKLETSAAMICS
jgi:hypothetical protein